MRCFVWAPIWSRGAPWTCRGIRLPASVPPPAAGMCGPAREGCPPPSLPARSPLRLLEFLCLLQARTLLLVSLAQQDHVLQHREERAAVQLTGRCEKKPPRRQPCGQNVKFDV